MSKILSVQNLYFNYDDKIILNNISIEIEENTISVILGRNGCGKTTLFDCLINYHNCYKGNIYLKKKNIKKLSIHDRALMMSYVPQVTSTIIDYDVREYLSIGRTPYILPFKGLSDKDNQVVLKYSKCCEIEHLLNKKILNLSGGEKQKVFIAKALIQETPFIIMDEPFSFLDIVNQNDILDLIKKIKNKYKKTFLISTHNPNHALYLDANVYLMSEGLIIKSGEAKNIVKPKLLKNVYGDGIVNSKDMPYKEISFYRMMNKNSNKR